jgi:hypothetical protein
MPPLRKQRFLRPSADLEAKREREKKSIEECVQLDLDDSPDIAKSTKAQRERIMME